MAREKRIKNKTKSNSLSGSVGALIAAGLVAGCSQVPDAINPVQWYNNSVEFFAGEEGPDDDAPQAAENAAPANTQSGNKSEAEFPLLSSIDQQQRAAKRPPARPVAKALVADVEGRKYAPSVARQGEAINALNAPPPLPPTASAQAPEAKAKTAATTTATETATTTATTTTAVSPAPATPEQAKAPVAVARARDLPSANQTVPSAATGNQQQDNFQARFALRLAEIRSRASQGTALPINAASPVSAAGYETVVVSSSGIEAGYGMAAAAITSPAINTATTYVEQAAGFIGPGAVKVATIRFANGSSRLSSRDRQILANVWELKKERGGRIHVVGHASSRTRNTDPVRHKMINFSVSAARADAIAKELMRMGADRAQLEINAISDSAPQYLEIMPTGEAGNRRAEIYLES